MFDYENIRDTVAEPLVADFGKPGTLLIPNEESGGDPWNRDPAASTEVSVTVLQTSLSVHNREGFIVEAGDLGFLMSTEGDPSPELADGIIVDGLKYHIIMIKPINPGPVKVLWKLQARK